MATTDILTTSSINSLITSYINSQTSQLITPLENKKSQYSSISSVYSTMSSKLSTLKSLMDNFRTTDNDSIFNSKTVKSSNSDIVNAFVTGDASVGSFSLRVNQLAKSDLLLSTLFNSDDTTSLDGTQTFSIKTGDGSGGEYNSNVEVDLSASDSYQTAIEKVRDAINSDKAIVNSDQKNINDSYTGGDSTIKFNIGGTETSVEITGGGTYQDMMDELISKINGNVSGLKAEKVVDPNDPNNIQLKLTLTDSSKYLSISQESGFDLVSDLNVAADNEKAASSVINASAISPDNGSMRLSLTSNQSGLDYRITNLSDTNGSSVLDMLGLNLAASRPQYDDANNPSAAGYLYSDTTTSNNELNAKFLFNGISLQRNSNTIGDLSSGVTFTLNSLMNGSDSNVTISVEKDVSSVKSNIEDFITKFNDAYSYIKTNATTTSSKRGTLAGDINAISLSSFFQSMAFTKVSGIVGNDLNNLYQLGITFNSQTGLSISDSATLKDKITEYPDQVAALFNSENGIANMIYDKIDPYLGTDGTLTNSINSFNSSISVLNDKKDGYQQRIDKSAGVMRSRYQQLQVQLASLMSMQNMLSYL